MLPLQLFYFGTLVVFQRCWQKELPLFDGEVTP